MIGNWRARVAFDLRLGHVGQRPDHDVPGIFGPELGSHRLESPTKEEIQEERLDDVVAVMAQCDLGDAVFRGPPVQRAASQT
jgi:hypothetical protein